ncbi:MAG: methionyl-tRNA formyltransferase [Deltaproteobacteria bacterium]|nr:methionyl-tRNA formyltransferase [Deltaproteobacteria bacterium]
MQPHQNNQPSVIFMGTPEFARIILEKLFHQNFPIKAVFAQPDKPAGRGKKIKSSPVALFARENNIPLFQPDKLRTPDVLETIKQTAPDFIIAAAYGKILPQTVLNSATIEALNVHGSILPHYRGAAPINYALMDGRPETGCSIMRMVKEMDAGPVYLIKKTPIEISDNAVSLSLKLAHIGADALIEAMRLISQDKLKPKEQDHTNATFAPKLARDLSCINWQDSSQKIFNLVRALVPWPVAATQLDGRQIKIYATEVLNTRAGAQAGHIVHIAKNGWTVATGTSDILVKEVQLEGKTKMKAFDLANGLRLESGTLSSY